MGMDGSSHFSQCDGKTEIHTLVATSVINSAKSIPVTLLTGNIFVLTDPNIPVVIESHWCDLVVKILMSFITTGIPIGKPDG